MSVVAIRPRRVRSWASVSRAPGGLYESAKYESAKKLRGELVMMCQRSGPQPRA